MREAEVFSMIIGQPFFHSASIKTLSLSSFQLHRCLFHFREDGLRSLHHNYCAARCDQATFGGLVL